MSQPAYTVTELDGTQGILTPSSGRLALIGPCAAGTPNLPQPFGRAKELVAALVGGPAVEAAAHYIDTYGKPVVVVPTGKTVAGAYGTVATTGAGTSVVTADAASQPVDDYEVSVVVVAGGTRSTAGITYKWSVDGGRTYSPVTALGVATSITIPGTGVKLDLGAGTLLAAQTITVRTTAPCWNAAELGAAFDALANSTIGWDIAEIVGPIDATSFDTVETKMGALFVRGKYRAWVGHTRMPNAAESEAAYLAALDGIFAAKASKFGSLCAGAVKMPSAVSGRNYRRPLSHVYAALEASVSEEINTADVNLGPLKVNIRDANGNPDEHDETINPGLDDARFVTARTWDEPTIQGAYVNRPRLFSPAGSDFQLMPHRRVLNLAHGALRTYFVRRLNSPVFVSRSTGFILEEEALDIEAGALAVMEAVLLAKPKASGCLFALSRTDNLLSTKTMNGQARVIPLAYPEFINLDLGFYNPALQVQAV